LAKIAVELEQALTQRARNGAPAGLTARMLAQGDGWSVEDVVCTSGPRDRSFEETHGCYRIAVVVAGSFQCRSESGKELMTPGSLLLGNAGECFECGHDHGSGDRCVSFGYSPGLFETLAADAGARGLRAGFPYLRLPPSGGMAALVARVCAGLAAPLPAPVATVWEELSVELAGCALQLTAETQHRATTLAPGAVARVTRAVRMMDRDPSVPLALKDVAQQAGLSTYHFLRVFEQLTGITPYQYLRRARLRNAAVRLAESRAKVLDVALDCGFGDISNFNHAFRAEFGVSPRAYRAQVAPRTVR
jgi:AraC family transcriptional regulator